MDQDRRTKIIFFIISVVLHGLFFGGLIFFQDFHFARSMPSVIQIDLVSFAPMAGSDKPGGGGAAEVKEDKKEAKQESTEVKESGEAVQPAEIKKEEPAPVIKPDISLKAKPKNLKDLLAEQEKKTKTEEKRKEEKTDQKIVNKELDTGKTTDKPNEKQDSNNMSAVLGRLRKKVAEQGKLRQGGSGEGGSGEGNKGIPGGIGKGGASAEQQFIFGIVSRIQENWVFNDSLARMDRNLEVTILIKILKSGEIRDIIFETRSGNAYLDESAKKAIMKVNPLPPLPAGMYSYDLGLIFTPQGLK
ncbi:MAG: hypothetical protein A2277_17635 [Desulfobacterales bacterium RIFOXYA12_FULL_46_15]|nr:MAG: hypothetical protein A2097_06610 [Desulfobacula sp. GWF2_41_7]OGR26884.1 MAG: hypothetical protein A2277_17635 [Desulfobacterales bacterium RIFOXYA12_FULL_46_15]